MNIIDKERLIAQQHQVTALDELANPTERKVKQDIYVVFRNGLFVGFQRANSPKEAKKKASAEIDLGNHSSSHNRHSRRAAGHTLRARKVSPEELRQAGYTVDLEPIADAGIAPQVGTAI